MYHNRFLSRFKNVSRYLLIESLDEWMNTMEIIRILFGVTVSFTDYLTVESSYHQFFFSDLVTAVDAKSFCFGKFMEFTLDQVPHSWQITSYQWACAPTPAHLLQHTALHLPLSLRLKPTNPSSSVSRGREWKESCVMDKQHKS